VSAPESPDGPLDVATLRAIVEQASDGIFITDAALCIAWVNGTACALLGYPRGDLVGKRIADLLEPDDLTREPLHRDELVSGQRTMTLRAFRTGLGVPRVLEVSATSIGGGRLLGIARDATERLRAQDRLARSEASFRTLIEASPDGVVVHRHGAIVYVNPAAAKVLGASSPAELVGTRPIDLVHPADRARVGDRAAALLRGESHVPFIDERLVRRDGSIITASVGAVRVVFEGEMSIVVVARDVTEQRHLQEHLAQTDRMVSLGALAAGVAHEINNPLAYVLLNLDALARLARRADPAELGLLAEHAALAQEGAQRVARIVRDLRAFSRSDDDVRVPIDVRRAIELAERTASHELKRRARVVLDLREVPAVLAGEGRLAQVFLNLLLNAADAIAEGHHDDNEIRVTTSFEAGEVRVAVRDTGCGIADAHRAHLFEPFFSTKPAGQGSGLGLAICHGLVQALGGRILVESELGRGSTFTVILPAAREDAPVPASREPEPRPPAPRARILVVDDEVAIGETLSRALDGRHDVVVASSGHAARAILERDAAFDVIVCDVVMPGMTGPELLRWIAEHVPALAGRVLLMSGGADRAVRALEGLEDWRWIDKPFSLGTFEAAVGAVLRRAAVRE
jgi:PAS domain S-box-containing protein